jgi:protein involved in polysaccharide export with SLBB domain
VDSVASTLGGGDLIEVRIFQEPELSGLYQVGGQGDLIFPLCRRVVVGGLTANGAAEKLRACLSEGFLRDPQVSVLVREFNSKKVFVFGERHAGGFTRTASQNSTSVTRRVDAQEVKVRVTVQDIALGKAPNFMLEPGDIVYVPEALF